MKKRIVVIDWLLPMLMNGQVHVVHSEDTRELGEAKTQLGMVAEKKLNYKTK